MVEGGGMAVMGEGQGGVTGMEGGRGLLMLMGVG